MLIKLTAQNLDLSSGHENVIILHEEIASTYGVFSGDNVFLYNKNIKEYIVTVVNVTTSIVDKEHIGLYSEIYKKYGIIDEDEVTLSLFEKSTALDFIRKKFKNQDLNYDEIALIMKDIVDGKLGLVGKTFFNSLIYSPGFNEDEIYSLTKAMAYTGEMFKFDGIVADKHSIGGISGKGITPIVVSIIASFGILIPNTSTKSITTPIGTSDMLKTIANITFDKNQILDLIKKTNACMVWGGGLALAPADDELIRVEKVLGMESYDKFLVSIIAKKVAMGITHLVIDLPAGPQGKLSEIEDIRIIKDKFISLGNKFGIKVFVSERYPNSIDGNGVGALIEIREVLYVFENNPLKSQQLEEDSIKLAGILLELTEKATPGDGVRMARESLTNGSAYNKFKEIIKSQNGKEGVTSKDLSVFKESITFKSVVKGRVKSILNKRVSELAKMLDCSSDQYAGVYFYKKPGDFVDINEKAFTIYSSSKNRLDLVLSSFITKNNLFEII